MSNLEKFQQQKVQEGHILTSIYIREDQYKFIKKHKLILKKILESAIDDLVKKYKEK